MTLVHADAGCKKKHPGVTHEEWEARKRQPSKECQDKIMEEWRKNNPEGPVLETVKVSHSASFELDVRKGFDTRWLIDMKGCPACGTYTKVEIKPPTMPVVKACKHFKGPERVEGTKDESWNLKYEYQVEKKSRSKKTAAGKKPGKVPKSASQRQKRPSTDTNKAIPCTLGHPHSGPHNPPAKETKDPAKDCILPHPHQGKWKLNEHVFPGAPFGMRYNYNGTNWPNSYLRNLNYSEGENEKALPYSNGIAILESDGTRLRCTPEGQNKVDKIIHPGDKVKTSWNTGPYTVVEVSRHEIYGLEEFSLILDDGNIRKTKSGKYPKNADFAYINELVAQNGRLLHLFEANKDEVIVLECSHKPEAEPFELKRPDGTFLMRGSWQKVRFSSKPVWGAVCPSCSIVSFYDKERKAVPVYVGCDHFVNFVYWGGDWQLGEFEFDPKQDNLEQRSYVCPFCNGLNIFRVVQKGQSWLAGCEHDASLMADGSLKFGRRSGPSKYEEKSVEPYHVESPRDRESRKAFEKGVYNVKQPVKDPTPKPAPDFTFRLFENGTEQRPYSIVIKHLDGSIKNESCDEKGINQLMKKMVLTADKLSRENLKKDLIKATVETINETKLPDADVSRRFLKAIHTTGEKQPEKSKEKKPKPEKEPKIIKLKATKTGIAAWDEKGNPVNHEGYHTKKKCPFKNGDDDHDFFSSPGIPLIELDGTMVKGENPCEHFIRFDLGTKHYIMGENVTGPLNKKENKDLENKSEWKGKNTVVMVPVKKKRKKRPLFRDPNLVQASLDRFFPPNQTEIFDFFEVETAQVTHTTQNLLILSCSQKKSDTAQERAIDLYQGQAYRIIRMFIEENPDINLDVYVLSAKYGLIDALESNVDEPWEPYDQKMDRERAEHWKSMMEGTVDIEAYRNANSFFYGSALYYSTLPFEIPHSQGKIGEMLHQLKEWLNTLKLEVVA